MLVERTGADTPRQAALDRRRLDVNEAFLDGPPSNGWTPSIVQRDSVGQRAVHSEAPGLTSGSQR